MLPIPSATLDHCVSTGWSEEDSDCDETDDIIHPGAKEIPRDGIDSNGALVHQ